MVHEYDEVEEELHTIIGAFPKLGKKRVFGRIKSHHGCDDRGDTYIVYYAEIEIPFVCRLAALAQDIDYTAPVWANIVALTTVILT